jgi:hypothetical protein
MNRIENDGINVFLQFFPILKRIKIEFLREMERMSVHS